MTDFLLELRSEEIPARMQVKAKEDLARSCTEMTPRACNRLNKCDASIAWS